MEINSKEIQKYEQDILDEFIKMKLNRPPEYNIESVSFMYTRISDKEGCYFKYDITADGTLVMHIYDLSIEHGIKNALATFAYNLEARFQLFARYLIGVYYPIVTMAVTVLPLYLLAVGDLLLSLLFGPLLFTILTLPVLIKLTQIRKRSMIAVRDHLIFSLQLSTIFSKEEIESHASRFTEHISYRFLADYVVFLPLVMMYILLMFIPH